MDEGPGQVARRPRWLVLRQSIRPALSLGGAVGGVVGGVFLVGRNLLGGAVGGLPLVANVALLFGGLMFWREYRRGRAADDPAGRKHP